LLGNDLHIETELDKTIKKLLLCWQLYACTQGADLMREIVSNTIFTYSSQNWSTVKTIDDENPTFEMHDDIRNGQIDDQLVSGRANVLVSEM